MQLKVPTVNSKLKKKNNLALLESIDLDFVPYACHYDEETILTKQGELLKIIKLEDYSSVDNYSDLRTEIRKSISKILIACVLPFGFIPLESAIN